MKRIQDTLIEKCFSDDGLYFRFEKWEALVTNPLSNEGFWVYVSRPVFVKHEGRIQFLEMINEWREKCGLESVGMMTKMSFMLSDTFPKENNLLKDFIKDEKKSKYGLEMKIKKKDDENWEDLIK